MSFATIWPSWLYPDAQPGDPYGWVVVACGHVMLGAIFYGLVRTVITRKHARLLAVSAYLAIEAVQYFLLGGDLVDGITDAVFVLGGMALADEALLKEPYGFSLMLVGISIALAMGALLRI
jgi:hypothetical protein